MSRRLEKINFTLKKALGDLVNLKLKQNFNVIVSISGVEVTADLALAKIFVSIMGDSKAKMKVMDQLESNSGLLKKDIPKYIYLRRTPELRFYLDETMEKAEKIERLIDEANSPLKN